MVRGPPIVAASVAQKRSLSHRGQKLDRVSSREIIVEAVLAALGLYLFVVDMFTAERPFLPPGLFKDRNFVCGVSMDPMTVMAFTTLTPALRGYATSLQALSRNIGQAVGVSITSPMLVRNVQTSHADIAAAITPFDRVLQGNDAVSHMLGPATRMVPERWTR